MQIAKKQVLVTVKAYPNPSKKYEETVCCAGVELINNKWVRLYPIPYRDLENDKKFKKYSLIEVDCFPPRDDTRPESFRIDISTLKVKGWFDTKNNWSKRKDIVLKAECKSMCRVYREAKENNLSLGLIRPERIAFNWERQALSNQQDRESCYAQLSFFDKKKKAIEKIPYSFYYLFNCADEANCPGHKLSIIDWEIGQAFRDWRFRYPDEQVLLEKIKERWMDIANTMKKDVFFYVGNMKRFRQTFMILGVFYPPIRGV